MKRCPACGKIVPRGHGYKSNRQYCDILCYRKMTPLMVKNEESLGKPLKEAIIEYLNRNQNITATAALLGTHKQQLYGWMKKLGIKKVLYWE